MVRQVQECNMKPYPPVSEQDERPAVCDLLETHRDGIDSMVDIVSSNSLYTPSLHDDLWLLRFYLSHGKSAKKAAQAATETMAFRAQHGLDDLERMGWLEARKSQEMEMPRIFQAYSNHMEYDAVFHTQPHGDRGLFIYVHLAGIDMSSIAAKVTKEEMTATMLITNEFYYRVLDEVTRRTGRLTKMVKVIDMDGTSISGLDHKFLKFEGKTAKTIEDFYPQLLAAVYLFNAPSWLERAWRVFSRLIPVRTRKKIDVISKNSVSDMPDNSRCYEHIRSCDLPVRFGGTSPEWPPQGSNGPPGNNTPTTNRFPGGLQTYKHLEVEHLVQ